MKPRFPFLLGALAGAAALLPAQVRADGSLSSAKLEFLDQRGYFTPPFKQAVRDLVEARQGLAQAKQQQQKLQADLPDVQAQAAAARAQVAALRLQLNLYEHPEDADFQALQSAMKNPAASPAERLALAQAFVWSYPNDPRQAEAEQDLRQIQAALANQTQAIAAAAAARAAAQANFLARVKARQLSLAEWQNFLQDKSQEDLLTYLGHPQTQGDDYWVYNGAFTTDPLTKAKVGLQINFNGGRVISVAAAPFQP